MTTLLHQHKGDRWDRDVGITIVVWYDVGRGDRIPWRSFRCFGKLLIVAGDEDTTRSRQRCHGRQSIVNLLYTVSYLEDVWDFSQCISQMWLCKRTCIIVKVRMSHNLLVFRFPRPILSLFFPFDAQPFNQEPARQ